MPAFQPSPGDPLEQARCEQCGYPLRGLTVTKSDAGGARCPECGTPFDPAKPWTPLPWPTRRRLAWVLCGPLMAIVLALVISGAARGTRELLIWPFFMVWAWALLFFALLWPIMAANSLATDRKPRVERARAVRDAYVPALLFNLAAAGSALVLFFALL